MEIKYDAAFIEKPDIHGLNKDDILMLITKLEEKQVYPVEAYNTDGESAAMGFIKTESAEKIEYLYDYGTEFNKEIGNILSDTEKERQDQTYNICGLTVLITR